MLTIRCLYNFGGYHQPEWSHGFMLTYIFSRRANLGRRSTKMMFDGWGYVSPVVLHVELLARRQFGALQPNPAQVNGINGSCTTLVCCVIGRIYWVSTFRKFPKTSSALHVLREFYQLFFKLSHDLFVQKFYFWNKEQKCLKEIFRWIHRNRVQWSSWKNS